MAKAIKVENLSKAYQLGDFGTGTISRDIERFIARIRGKEDPFLRIGEVNDRTTKGESDIVWSLKNMNFEFEQGDAVGLIGRNGAGKSTLLKILSRITSPTLGTVKVKGRVASLLEVGTGFHPELTGRENIYLNGAILGMRKKEIKRKFDEIVDFSGVERYIDTPVKRYSSGMYVRLAFAVAAHLESEILIVDEVLAVGDAEFQKKCLGKMGDVSKGEGRTVLFVSHNMEAVEILCNKTMYLQRGTTKNYGNTPEIITQYLNNTDEKLTAYTENVSLGTDMFINMGITHEQITSGENLDFNLKIFSKSGYQPTDLAVLIYNEKDVRVSIIDLRNELKEINNVINTYEIKGTILGINLLPGFYNIKLYVKSDNFDANSNNLIQFLVKEKYNSDIIPYPTNVRGYVNFDYEVDSINIL